MKKTIFQFIFAKAVQRSSRNVTVHFILVPFEIMAAAIIR